MFFLIWTIFWLTQVTAFSMLAVPAAAYVVRAAYLDRPMIERLHIIPLLIINGIFVFLLITDPAASPYSSGLLCARILASSFILIHVTRGLRGCNLRMFGATLGTLIVISQRCLTMEKRFILDSAYSFNVRWRHSTPAKKARILMWMCLFTLAVAIACLILCIVGKGGFKTFLLGAFLVLVSITGIILLIFLNEDWKRRCRLLGGITKTITLALVTLYEEMNRLHEIRGRLPITTGWTIPPLRRVPVFVADLVSFVVILVFAIVDPHAVVPKSVLSHLGLASIVGIQGQ
jgi:hypothetical protein